MKSRLQKSSKYSFHEKDIFRCDEDVAHAFTKKNYSTGMHMQDFFEINVISKGTGMHYIGEERTLASVGDVFVIPPNTPHGYVQIDPLDVYHVIFSSKFLEGVGAPLRALPCFSDLFSTDATPYTRPRLTLSAEKFREFNTLFSEMARYRKSSKPTYMMMQGLLCASIVTLLTDLYASERVEKTAKPRQKNADILLAVAMIHDNLGEHLTIDALAKKARLSRSSFIRRFKEIMGRTPAAYVSDVRIDEAKRLLTESALALSTIADECGFCDSAHFSREFKRSVGISPLEYRRQNTTPPQRPPLPIKP